MQRATKDLRLEIERQRDRHNHVVQDVAIAGRQNRPTLTDVVVTIVVGCNAFTRNLHHVVWPPRFKPNLPPHYDGKNYLLEFLQLYTLAI